MKVDNLDRLRAAVSPAEADAPLIVDPDAVLPGATPGRAGARRLPRSGFSAGTYSDSVFKVPRNDDAFLADSDAALLGETVELSRSLGQPEAWHLQVLQREALLLETRSLREIPDPRQPTSNQAPVEIEGEASRRASAAWQAARLQEAPPCHSLRSPVSKPPQKIRTGPTSNTASP